MPGVSIGEIKWAFELVLHTLKGWGRGKGVHCVSCFWSADKFILLNETVLQAVSTQSASTPPFQGGEAL